MIKDEGEILVKVRVKNWCIHTRLFDRISIQWSGSISLGINRITWWSISVKLIASSYLQKVHWSNELRFRTSLSCRDLPCDKLLPHIQIHGAATLYRAGDLFCLTIILIQLEANYSNAGKNGLKIIKKIDYYFNRNAKQIDSSLVFQFQSISLACRSEEARPVLYSQEYGSKDSAILTQ